MTAICIKAVISGRVQGVGFRYSTQHEASRLQLTGHAKNLSDGTVEVVACGEQAQIDRLLAWLAQGPPMATVTDVSWQVIDKHTLGHPSGFITG